MAEKGASNSEATSRPRGVARFVLDNSLLLILGAVCALIWANARVGPRPVLKIKRDSGERLTVDLTQRELIIGSAPDCDVVIDAATVSDRHARVYRVDDAVYVEALRSESAVFVDGQRITEPHQLQEADKIKVGKDELTFHIETGYERFVHTPIWHGMPFAKEHGLEHGLDIHFLINDIFMALFFAIAAKEVWEALLPGGPLSNPRRAAVPLLCAAGGMAGPALIFIGGALALGNPELVRGWAVPCATDIAFSYLIARMIFRPGHPAIAFLLMLAIADDAGGLIILAIAYPQSPFQPAAFLLTGAAIAMALGMRKLGVHSFWWYLLGPGVLSWISFYISGVHAALGLVPIIPCMPHAHTDLGLFARGEKHRHDTLNEFEHWWKYPVEIILGLFALANAGVVFSSIGTGTVLVLAGLIIGKPLGITLFALFGEKVLRLQLPYGMKYRHVITVGLIAAIGFTVALFVATAAFPSGKQLDQVKMGALASIGAAAIALVGARLLGVRRDEEPLEPESEPDVNAKQASK